MKWRLLFAVLFGAAGAFVPAAPASAAPTGPCTDDTGVTVLVDFQELGGGVYEGCAPQPVANGLDALARAGFTASTATRFPGYVCKIEGKPENAGCVNASPANAYWSYWTAPRGGQWQYSNVGAGTRVPPPGSMEGWRFAKDKVSAEVLAPGVTSPPATTPPTVAPVAPPPPAAPSETSAPVIAGGANPTAPPATRAPRVAGTPTTTAVAAPVAEAPASATPTTEASAIAPDVTSSPANPIAATGEAIDFDDAPDDSSPLPTIIGIVVILAVGGAAAFVMMRRRGT